MDNTIILHGVEYIVVDIKNESVFDYVEEIKADSGAVLGYRVLENIAYFSLRYNKWVTVEAKDVSDGATSAPDIDSFCWVFHDELCEEGMFDDCTICSNWQASKVLSDILCAEDRWFRAFTWFWATWSVGGGKARENGLW